jgi:hypothetical protein
VSLALAVPEVLRPSRETRIVRQAAGDPKTALGLVISRAIPLLPAELADELRDILARSVVFESALRARVVRGLGLFQQGLIPREELVVEDYGVVSRKVITTAGVNFLVDAFQNLTELENFKYHGIGTGTGAEANGDTALGTELTTEYNPDSTRATGSQTEGASANIYRSVGTNTLDSGTPAVTEHGLFSASSAGTLWDRSKFSAINLVGANGDGLQTTYDMTASAGG